MYCAELEVRIDELEAKLAECARAGCLAAAGKTTPSVSNEKTSGRTADREVQSSVGGDVPATGSLTDREDPDESVSFGNRTSEAMVNGRRPCPGCGETANQRMRIKHKSDCTVMANPPRTNDAPLTGEALHYPGHHPDCGCVHCEDMRSRANDATPLDATWLNHRLEMAKGDVRWWHKLLTEAIETGDWAKARKVHYEMGFVVRANPGPAEPRTNEAKTPSDLAKNYTEAVRIIVGVWAVIQKSDALEKDALVEQITSALNMFESHVCPECKRPLEHQRDDRWICHTHKCSVAGVDIPKTLESKLLEWFTGHRSTELGWSPSTPGIPKKIWGLVQIFNAQRTDKVEPGRKCACRPCAYHAERGEVRTNEAQVAHQKLEVAHQKLETARRRQALSDAAIHRSLRRISERMGLAKMYDHDPVGFVGVLESEVNNDKERIVGGCKAENEAARSGDSEVIGDEDREEQHDAHVLEDDDVCDGRLGSGGGPPSKAEGESKQDLVVEAGTGGRFGCCGAEPAYIRGRPVPHSHPQRSDKAKSEPEPIPMYLTCPRCSARHIDEREFIKKPHHTHSCQACGLTWRPAVVPTVGVLWLPGFKNEWSIDHFFPTLEYKGETVHVKDPESLAAMHRLIEKVRNDTRTQFEPRETDACEPRPETPKVEESKK